MLGLAADEKTDGSVINRLVVGREETTWQFPVIPVKSHAITALSPPLAGVGTGAMLLIRFLGAFHSILFLSSPFSISLVSVYPNTDLGRSFFVLPID